MRTAVGPGDRGGRGACRLALLVTALWAVAYRVKDSFSVHADGDGPTDGPST